MEEVMKRIFLTIASVYALFSSVALAESGAYYTNIFGGLNDLDELEEIQDAGYVIGGSFGTYLTPHFSYEGEFTFKQNDLSFDALDEEENITHSFDVNIKRYNIGLNGIFDFISDGFFRPYVGVGVAGSYQHESLQHQDSIEAKSASGKYDVYSKDHRCPIIQEFAGLKINLNNLDMSFEMRFSQPLKDTDAIAKSDNSLQLKCGYKF